MNKRFLYIFLLIFLAGVLILPQACYSSEYELSEVQANNILNSVQQKLIDEWINITSSSNFSEPEKQAALFLIRNGIQKKELSYWLEEVPKEYLKTLIKTGAFLLVYPDISSVLDKIEKETVKQAVKIAKDWLLQNEIKIANGPLKYAYVSYKGNKQEPDFHYIISEHYLNNNKSEVIIEFYSPGAIEPKASTGNVLWLNAASWEFDSWRAAGNEKLDPFIVRVKGKTDDFYGGYVWDESTRVEVIFSEQVPEYPFEPEPSSFWQKIMKELKKEISGTIKDFKDIFDVFTEIKEKMPFPTDFGAQVSQPLSSTFQEEELKEAEQIISSIKEEIKELEDSSSSLEKENPAEDGFLSGPDLDELQEKIDDIKEMIDAMSKELEEIIEEQTQYALENEEQKQENEEETEEEAELDETEEETEDETEEDLDQGIPVALCQINQSHSPLRNKIIFNEIAWMGTNNSANDEWLELKNISNQEINLSGWQILDKDEQIRIVFQQEGAISKILSNGFYLLERTDDETVPDIIADFIYTGALNNSNEALYLFDQNCQLQDEVVANPDWHTGNKDTKRTMERKTNLEWQTSANINGTPKTKNSRGYSESSGGGGAGGGGGADSGNDDAGSSQDEPILEVSSASLEFTAIEFGPNPTSQTSTITNTGKGILEWTSIVEYTSPSVEGVGWLTLDPDYGTAPSEIAVSVDIFGLTPGIYSADVIISADGIQGSPQKINVSLNIQTFPEEQPSKILITEILFDAEGSDEKKEFVELYNPNDSKINVSGWSLQYLSPSAISVESVKRKNFEEGNEISAKSYFLIGLNGREGDMSWSQSLGNNGGTVFLVNDQGPESNITGLEDENIIDRVGYGEGLILSEGTPVDLTDFEEEKSIGRKWNSQTGEYQDTDNNSVDFEIQTPTPKNKNQSIEEPDASFEIVVSDADAVWNLNLTAASADIIDSTDAPLQNLTLAFVSHADSVWGLDFPLLLSDIVDSKDAPIQTLFEVFVSMGEAFWNIDLKKY